MDKDLNIEHAANPQIGDYWHERFSPSCLVIGVTPFSVSYLSKMKYIDGNKYWDTAHVATCNRAEFKRWVSYNSIPGTWCDVVPNWPPANGYIEEAMGIAIPAGD